MDIFQAGSDRHLQPLPQPRTHPGKGGQGKQEVSRRGSTGLPRAAGAAPVARGTGPSSARCLWLARPGSERRFPGDRDPSRKRPPALHPQPGHQQSADAIVAGLEKQGLKVLALFRDYLDYGYYPYFQEYGDKSLFYVTLEQNLRTTLESDLPAIHPTLNGSSIRRIEKLLSIIAGLVHFTPDMKSLKRLLGISDERTLKNYLRFLEDAGVILTLSRSSKGLRAMEKGFHSGCSGFYTEKQ